MKDLLKYTYLLDTDNINRELQSLWDRYQIILEDPNWGDLNEARSILYIIGYLYPEQIGPEAIERRLHLLENPITMLEFLHLVDKDSPDLSQLRSDHLFVKLEKLYKIIKKYKNLETNGKWYLDEEKFVELYNQYSPSKDFKIGRFGKFGDIDGK